MVHDVDGGCPDPCEDARMSRWFNSHEKENKRKSKVLRFSAIIMGAPKAAAWSYDHRPNIHLTVAIQTQECLGTRAEVNRQTMKTFGSCVCVHTLFSLLLRARRCFQGGPVRPSPSQPTLSSFSEGVGLGITHDIKPITCHDGGWQ